MRARVLEMGFGLIAGLASLGFAAQARPSLSPRNISFTAKGQVTITKGVSHPSCTAHFVGTTDAAGFGQITSATFTGSDFCAAVTSATLPWSMNAETRRRALLKDVDLGTPLGFCGPVNVTVYVSSTGRFTFSASAPPDCFIQGYVKTTPVVTIVKP
jgi:hypothetical protein